MTDLKSLKALSAMHTDLVLYSTAKNSSRVIGANPRQLGFGMPSLDVLVSTGKWRINASKLKS